MVTAARGVALYVDKANGRWVVRDAEGRFWILAYGDNPWDGRQPFTPAEETDLEPVPGHYKYLLGLP
jgi:hypothetical protein